MRPSPRASSSARARRAPGDAGAGFDLRIMAAHGGTISIDAKELARTLISGPIGGVIGARYLADQVSSATARDPREHRLHRHRRHQLRHRADHRRRVRDPPDARHGPASCSTCRWCRSTRSAPGRGSFVRIDPNSGRPELGPDSAGARIGVCWAEGGLETPSVTDLNLVLGRVNPDYFLGGDVKLDTERARARGRPSRSRRRSASRSRRRRPAIIELFDETLNTRRSPQVLGKGYSPVDYTLLCYGGGGPLHVAGYTDGVALPRRPGARVGGRVLRLRLRLRRLRVPLRPHYRHADRAPAPTRTRRLGIGMLRRRRLADAARAGRRGVREVRRRAEDEIEFRHYVRMQYYGQLNDLEIYSPHQEIDGGPTRRRPDRRVRGRLRQVVRALGAALPSSAIWSPT